MAMKFTHNAFLTRHYEDCLDFYTKYCGMRVVKDRPGDSPSLPNIAWLAPKDGAEPIFVIAEAPGMNELSEKSEPIMRHFGFELEDRHAVDRLYRRTFDAGLKPSPPRILGRHCRILVFCSRSRRPSR